MNSLFPVDELELLPNCFLETSAAAGKDPHQFTCTEKITCTLDTASGVELYCNNVPPALRSVKQVNICRGGDLSKVNEIVSAMQRVFSEEGVVAHTLVVEDSSTELVCALVEANLENMSRLILENGERVDFDRLLPLLVGHRVIEELVVDGSPSLHGGTFHLIAQCQNIAFRQTPTGFMVPPPKAAARLALLDIPMPDAIPVAEFKKLPKEERTLGLMTAYGTVVPIGQQLVPRFQLLKDVLEESDGQEALVPMQMDPPPGKDALSLAVHFVTHCVTDDVHRSCEEAEAQKSNSSSDDSTFIPAPATFSWCSAFDRFYTLHIQQRYATSQRRIHVMCDLMAVAVHLNCPSLKRFLRAALVLEEMEEEENAHE